MGDIIRRKIAQYTAFIIAILTVSLVAVGVLIWEYQKLNIEDGDIRIKVNQLIFQLEQSIEDKVSLEFELPYCVLNENGMVQFSTLEDYLCGELVDWHTLGGVNRYLVPIQKKDGIKKMIFVDCVAYQEDIARKNLCKFMIIPVASWGLLLTLLWKIRKIENEDVWLPVKQLHEATKSILEKKSDVEVKYDYDSEIGMLCHDFERMREEILDSYKRELKAREKEKVMYASISHDLKTPLASVTGYLEEILFDVVHTRSEIKASANQALNKAVIINKLIDDVLEHSKAQLNELSIHKQEVYAQDYFKELLSEYALDAKRKKYTFTYDLPVNVLIRIDTDRIAEVMQNLISNAEKYGKDKISIEVKFESILEPDAMLIVSVKDHGRGIEAADLPFIFDMFYRGNKARTSDIVGSGLGLNISKYIVEQHGGQIECDSIVGVGTTISFSIPYL